LLVLADNLKEVGVLFFVSNSKQIPL